MKEKEWLCEVAKIDSILYKQTAKKLRIEVFPSIVLFYESHPIIYKGNIKEMISLSLLSKNFLNHQLR